MKPPFTILYLCDTLHDELVYGAERSLTEIVHGLDRDRFVAHAIVRSGALKQALQEAGATVHFADLHPITIPGPRGVSRFAYRFLRFWQIVRSVKPAIMHANDWHSNQCAALGGLLARVPSVCHVRTISSRAYRQSWAFLSSAIIANSHSSAAPLRALVGRGQRLRVVYNGVDTERFRFDASRRAATRTKLGLADSQLVIGVVGRLVPGKRQDLLLTALQQASRRVSDCVGLVVGDVVDPASRAYVSDLQGIVERYGMGNQVRFTGFIDDMVALYSAMDVLVSSSDAESFGRAVAEAMAAERPVIATAVGGVREIVRHGKTGLLVPHGDSSAMADAIVALANDPEKRRQMGEAGRERVAQRFSVDRCVRGVQGVYEELLSAWQDRT